MASLTVQFKNKYQTNFTHRARELNKKEPARYQLRSIHAHTHARLRSFTKPRCLARALHSSACVTIILQIVPRSGRHVVTTVFTIGKIWNSKLRMGSCMIHSRSLEFVLDLVIKVMSRIEEHLKMQILNIHSLPSNSLNQNWCDDDATDVRKWIYYLSRMDSLYRTNEEITTKPHSRHVIRHENYGRAPSKIPHGARLSKNVLADSCTQRWTNDLEQWNNHGQNSFKLLINLPTAWRCAYHTIPLTRTSKIKLPRAVYTKYPKPQEET